MRGCQEYPTSERSPGHLEHQGVRKRDERQELCRGRLDQYDARDFKDGRSRTSAVLPPRISYTWQPPVAMSMAWQARSVLSREQRC